MIQLFLLNKKIFIFNYELFSIYSIDDIININTIVNES